MANAPCLAAASVSRSHIRELAVGKELRLLSQQRSREHIHVPGSEDAKVKGTSFLPSKLPCHKQIHVQASANMNKARKKWHMHLPMGGQARPLF